jgi:hypothetical protein
MRRNERACLSLPVADKGKSGLVMHGDWELKADALILLNGKRFIVSSVFGEENQREEVETRRDEIERRRKENTAESSHWENAELPTIPEFRISRTERNTQKINEVRLFSSLSINSLLEAIYEEADASSDHRWTFPR